MKNILIACIFSLTAGILSAQQAIDLEFTVKTPFAVSGTTLPAGTYNIRLVDADENIFECEAKAGSPSVLFEADPHEVIPTSTGVTFAKYGDKLVLKNISVAGNQGYWIPLSITEKRQKKGGVKPTAVTTAATKK